MIFFVSEIQTCAHMSTEQNKPNFGLTDCTGEIGNGILQEVTGYPWVNSFRIKSTKQHIFLYGLVAFVVSLDSA